MNKVILMGRLTRDPEVRYSAGDNSTAVARYTLAVNRRFKRDNEPTADFVPCVAFGKVSSAIFRSMRTSKQLPCPSSLSTSMVPPIASTRFLVIAIPSPVPCILLVTELSARVNGSKIVSLKSADIPIPLSLTKKRYFA